MKAQDLTISVPYEGCDRAVADFSAGWASVHVLEQPGVDFVLR